VTGGGTTRPPSMSADQASSVSANSPVPNAPAPKSGGLGLRILSALVMIPVALATVWFGSPYLPLMTVLLAAGMAWEWARMVAPGAALADTLLVGVALVSAVLAGFGLLAAGFGLALLGALLVWRVTGSVLAGLGTLWVVLPCLAFVAIAGNPAWGRAAVFWLLAVVWATDTGAYAAGRVIGGPRLAPAVSPNKTWAGFWGGLAAAALAGWATAALTGTPALGLVPVSLVLGLAAQFGDLVESAVKRHFGVKDSGAFIPGHGGLLDRLDSLLGAAAVLGLLILAGAGPLISLR
jgi:phosphatidate cytidylyltransferase